MSHDCGILDMLHDGPAAIKNKDTFTKEDVTAYKYTFLRGEFCILLKLKRRSGFCLHLWGFTLYRDDSDKSPIHNHW